MGMRVHTGKPVVERIELGTTHGSAVYVTWRNLGEMLRKIHNMTPTEGVGGVTVDENGIHVFFGDTANGDDLL